MKRTEKQKITVHYSTLLFLFFFYFVSNRLKKVYVIDHRITDVITATKCLNRMKKKSATLGAFAIYEFTSIS